MERPPLSSEPLWIQALPQEERAIIERVRDIRFGRLSESTSGEREERSERTVEYAQRLGKKYGSERSRYRLYHALIGSTPGEDADLFDFPGEDSVLLFAEKELLTAGVGEPK